MEREGVVEIQISLSHTAAATPWREQLSHLSYGSASSSFCSSMSAASISPASPLRISPRSARFLSHSCMHLRFCVCNLEIYVFACEFLVFVREWSNLGLDLRRFCGVLLTGIQIRVVNWNVGGDDNFFVLL